MGNLGKDNFKASSNSLEPKIPENDLILFTQCIFKVPFQFVTLRIQNLLIIQSYFSNSARSVF